MIGSDESGELVNGIACFMIAGLKEFIPYVIKSSSEITLHVSWLRNELFECLDVLFISMCVELFMIIINLMCQYLKNYWRDATKIRMIFV